MIRDRRAAAALEFALAFPAILLLVFGIYAAYSLVSTWRAMDVGLQRALRYAAVNGGGGQANVAAAYRTAARVVWTAAGNGSTVTVTPATFTAGQDVTIAASYAWGAPATLAGTLANPIFAGITLTTSATIRVVH